MEKSETELQYLKQAHGKLQKVLTDKGTELSQAVRRAEVYYEREATKLRHKLGELKKQQQIENSSRREHEHQVKKRMSNLLTR